MRIGVTYPQTELGADRGAIAEWIRGVESMGLSHMLAYDHVIGAGRTSRPDWQGPYDVDSMFMEPLVLFSFMAAITRRIEFLTGVLILPQRQTVLVAKQAACLDVLSGGRLRLGVGTGWNDVEYESLNVPFKERGAIFEDQIEVLRQLWTKPSVTLKTAYHSVPDAGINPRPQRSIPIWFGGGGKHPVFGTPNVERVVRRAARLGDGWMPTFAPNDEGKRIIERFRTYVREYGRDPAAIGLEGVVTTWRRSEDRWGELVESWRKLGATHLSFNTMLDGLRGPEQHLRRLEEAIKALPQGLSPASQPRPCLSQSAPGGA